MFLAGFFTGVIATIAFGFTFNFYKKSERKDELLADFAGKEFEEEITLKNKDKKKAS